MSSPASHRSRKFATSFRAATKRSCLRTAESVKAPGLAGGRNQYCKLLISTSTAARTAAGSGARAHARTPRIRATSPAAAGLPQNSAQASMSLRRFSKRSPRLYAFSTADGIACAKAISQTSR
jgi:hypothetical protein